MEFNRRKAANVVNRQEIMLSKESCITDGDASAQEHWEDLITVFTYLQGRVEQGLSLFYMSPKDRIGRDNKKADVH